MHDTDLVLTGILVGVAALLVLAYLSRIPYPILLVVGGAAIGFVPGMPEIELDPELVLLILLPPLLYSAAFFSSLRDLRANLAPISMLAVGLVLFTMVGVAAVAHYVIGMGWEVSFVLGAIVSPTDPVAATSIGRRVGLPPRIVTIVEGESLVNDSTALIAYRTAVVAAVSGSFSLLDASATFVFNAIAGVAIGLAVGWLVAQVRSRIEDAPTEITISIFTPFFAYLPAEALEVSAVLAAVSAGVYLGWNSPRLISPPTRIEAFAVWNLLVFLLNAALFTLVGLQLPGVLDNLDGRGTGDLVWWAVAVSLTVMVTRFLWIFPLSYLSGVLGKQSPPWRNIAVLGWTGMRGAVSLAAALAVPLTVDGGAPFPDRDLLIFLTYAVILSTLLLQGLTLPAVIRALGVTAEDGDARYWESKARLLAADAALGRLEELRDEDWVRGETADRVRQLYEYRRRRFASRFADDDGESMAIEERALDYQRLLREILEAQRRRVVELRNEGRINDEIMRRIERDLDLEDNRLEVGWTERDR
jgi:CPA1 family monovalent cation:H+ antiporter